MKRVSIYKNAMATDGHVRNFRKVLELIKGGRWKDKVEHIRTLSKEQYDVQKKQLPAVAFSGTFSKRNSNSLRVHSNLLTLDFDKLKDADKFKSELNENPLIFCSFISPSGKGVKALVKCTMTHSHKEHMEALLKEFPAADVSGKNVDRLCFVSYDPGLHINEDCDVFTKYVDFEAKISKATVKKPITNHNDIFDYLKVWLSSKNEDYYEGGRNNFLYKFAQALNRFGVPKDTAKELLYYQYVSGDSTFKATELDAIMGCYNKNKDKFNTAAFEKGEVMDISRTVAVVITPEDFDVDEFIDGVTLLSDLSDDMIHDYWHGAGRGETTHWEEIDTYFRWIKPEVTVLFGIGNMGKTQMMFNMMMAKSVRDGHKWGVFSPEMSPPKRFYRELIKIYVGKSFFGGEGRMTEGELKSAMEFVTDHFFLVDDDNPTVENIHNKFAKMIIKYNLDGVLVDPYNKLVHKSGTREDEYIRDYLRDSTRWAAKYNVYYVIIAHTNGKIDKLPRGDFDVPSVNSIAGGVMWNNGVHNLLCYHRPYFYSEPDNTSVYLRSIKIKDQDRNGKRGTAELFYNKERYMFYDAHNQQPFAREESVSDPVILDMASKGRELIEEFDITNQLFE